VSDAPEDVVQIVRAGARGYVTKSISGEDLIDAVVRVNEGDAVFSPQLAGFVLDAFSGRTDPATTDAELDLLTPREQEVLQLIARGYLYKEIARRLGISVKTVEAHASSVLRKLQLHPARASHTGRPSGTWSTSWAGFSDVRGVAAVRSERCRRRPSAVHEATRRDQSVAPSGKKADRGFGGQGGHAEPGDEDDVAWTPVRSVAIDPSDRVGQARAQRLALSARSPEAVCQQASSWAEMNGSWSRAKAALAPYLEVPGQVVIAEDHRLSAQRRS
jgi:DNA-binding CsgD family transcriptional regulator